jgi:hypothetical protein
MNYDDDDKSYDSDDVGVDDGDDYERYDDEYTILFRLSLITILSF